MDEKWTYEKIISVLDPKKAGDKAWFLSLLDDDVQREYETVRLDATLRMLHLSKIRPHKQRQREAQAKIRQIESADEKTANDYQQVKELLHVVETERETIESFRPFFDEPYFARMDVVDGKEGYNSYYIGRKGDVRLEIVDWRAPLARRYYQKSCSTFTINEYDYKTVLRRALKTRGGKIQDFKNEYLSLKEYLTAEEIGDKEQDNVLDPYLREIIQRRKEESTVKDIIETIQEKQYEIITCPEDVDFVLQGCAGSGKTMVMLHRLSYLMYNHDDVKNHDVLIITPSNSFNDFIDELATVLQLEKVKTVTVYEYFLQLLQNEKIEIQDKIDLSQKEPPQYLEYVYSSKFIRDVKTKTEKVYDSLYGLFTGEECREFIATIVRACKKQLRAYEGIKNSSLRIRRAVLGEIKEKPEGGLYYTKPFRDLMNCILETQDFFAGTLNSARAENPAYFYRQMISFYKSAGFVARYAERIIEEAQNSLVRLQDEIEREIVDLKRFRQRAEDGAGYLYPDRIARREELLKEVVAVQKRTLEILDENDAFSDFYTYLRGEKNFSAVGSGKDFVDVVRFFYRETVKKYKQKYGVKGKKMVQSDAYALCLICNLLGKKLSPAYSYVFVDEAQDISAGEYALLRAVNAKARFNVFGDLEQNVTPYRGVKSWETVFDGFELYTLNQNYRNTNQIVDYVSSELSLDMQSIGFDGPPVEFLSPRKIAAYFQEKKGLKAVICAESCRDKYLRKSYHVLSEKGRLSQTKINYMTVYESKGLEFSSVVVLTEGMSESEKYIAFTRALKHLAVVDNPE